MLRKLFFAFLVLALHVSTCHAEGYERVKKDLAINRQMISRFQLEESQLLVKPAQELTGLESKRLEDLQYKIKGLKSDASELLAVLPPEEQAAEYISFLLTDEATKPKKELKTFEISQQTRPLHEKALALVADQKYKEAASTYEQIVLIDPHDDQAYLLMGHCFLLTEQYEKSESAFQNAVHITPENIDEIAPFYENSVVQNPSDENYANLGYAYLILSAFSKAKKAFWEALQINPTNAKAMTGMRLIENRGL